MILLFVRVCQIMQWLYSNDNIDIIDLKPGVWNRPVIT